MLVYQRTRRATSKLLRPVAFVKRGVLPRTYATPYKETGRRIAQLRRETGWKRNQRFTQRMLAEELGVAESTVTAWEVGKQEPEGTNLANLARFFTEALGRQVTAAEIISGPPQVVAENGVTPEAAEELFLSLPYVTRFLGGIAPPGQAKELKLDSLEGYRRMIQGRAPVPPWWYDLKRKIEDGEL